MTHGQDVDCERIEDAVRDLLLELHYEPDEPPGQVVACCQAACREIVQWRGDWNRPPRAFSRLADGRWPGLRLADADESKALGDVDIERLPPFLRRRVETETDVRDRITRAIADADSTADDAPQRYRRMADAAMDAMEADR